MTTEGKLLARAVPLVLLLASGAAGGTEPGLKVTSNHRDYTIAGTTAPELRAAMDQLGPLDAGKRVDAVTKWWISWHYTYRQAGGSCAIARADVVVKIEFRLPVWRNSTSVGGSLLQQWQRYLQLLQRHEDGHANDAIATGRALLHSLQRLPARPSCASLGSTADALGEAQLKRATVWDVAYDRRTHHGATQGAVFP